MRSASIGSPAVSPPRPSIEGAAPSGEAGFTLLETLIALAILAIALVSLYEAQTQGARATGVASGYAQARILAQALLADAMSPRGKAPAARNGQEGRFVWSVAVAPETAAWAQIASKDEESSTGGREAFTLTRNAAGAKRSWRMYRVRVTVGWDNSRRIALDALKLGAARE